jgi:hypothetical protein
LALRLIVFLSGVAAAWLASIYLSSISGRLVGLCSRSVYPGSGSPPPPGP